MEREINPGRGGGCSFPIPTLHEHIPVWAGDSMGLVDTVFNSILLLPSFRYSSFHMRRGIVLI